MTNDFKIFLTRVGNIPAFAVFRSAFVIYATFFFAGFPVSRFFPFFSPAPLPLFDLGLFHSAAFCVLIRAIYLISIPILIFGAWVEYSGLFAGLSLLLLNFLYPNEVWSFNYYAPLAFVAFAVTESARKKKNEVFPAETPLALFMSSVYLSASLQKLTHFDLTMKWLSYELVLWSRPQFLSVCPGADCSWLQFLTKGVIPIELALGLLFLFRSTRIWGLVLAFCFHTGMYSAASLRSIGIMLFTTQCSVALLASQWPIRKVFSDRRILRGLFFLVPLGFALGILYFFSSNEAALASEFVWTIVCFWPFLLIGFFSFRDQKKSQKATTTIKSFFLSENLLFACFLLAFSLFPTFEGYRKTQSMGWAMFSGAFLQNPYYFVKVKSENCEMRYLEPMVFQRGASAEEKTYSSLDEDFLKRYLSYLSEKCPEAQISPVGTKYINR